MKRSILLVCVLALICAILGGCGSYRGDGMAVETPTATVDLVPDVSPMATMDPADGIVRDQDGVIEDRDTGTPGATVSPMPTVSPAQSAKPVTNAKP